MNALPDIMLFDLDGTLVDSVPDIAASVDDMLEHMGRARAGEGTVRTWVGNGLELLIHRALSGVIDGRASAEDHSEGVRVFRSHYARQCTDRTTAYEGAAELLDWLIEREVRVGITTNKPADFARRIVAAIGLDPHVEVLLGAGEGHPLKPDPSMLLEAQAQLGGGEAWLVGDSLADRDAARAANIPFVALRMGYNHGTDIAESVDAATPVFDSLTQFLTFLKERVA